MIQKQKDDLAPFFLSFSDIGKIHGQIQEETGENTESEEGEMNGLSRHRMVRIVLHSKERAFSNMVFEFAAKQDNDKRNALCHF